MVVGPEDRIGAAGPLLSVEKWMTWVMGEVCLDVMRGAWCVAERKGARKEQEKSG